ncbi:MAG: IS1380 family transposase [Planctomycetota bacterium]
MAARIPILKKTPFVLDPRPLTEASSPHAGLLATSRAFRALGFPDLIGAQLKLRKRRRGFDEGQLIESIVLLQTVGGDCPEDIRLIANDPCLARGVGYEMPKVTAIREFLELFHDEEVAQMRPSREEQKSFIFPSTEPVAALQEIQGHGVRRIAKRYEDQGQALRIATVDQDATIIESHKKAALPHYQGGRGYQPMVAVWAEADLVLADEFRDGNVPARQEPLGCAQQAFAALPSTLTARYFRGDSGCHENGLLEWLSHSDRSKEPGGAIGFAVSASNSEELSRAMKRISNKDWTTFDTESDGTLRQWAEVPFVPGKRYERKDSRPLRYVGLRLVKPQGELFGDGSDKHYHAVITNRDLRGDLLLNWHREKAGTIEHVHDEIKNALGGGHMPSQRFAVNAAWFKLALLTYNVASATKGLCFTPEERTVRFKKYRLLLVHLSGRMNRNNCVMGLRLCASKEAIARMLKVWEVFALPTQATAAKAMGRPDP